MSQRVLLDTSVCVPLINRSDAALARALLARTPGSIVLCSVVRAALEFGARNSSRVAENLDRLTRFCRAFEPLPVDDGAACRYGVLRAELRREGRPIGANDMTIASIALAADIPLATRNVEEFCRVPGLVVERW